jgi:Flp pilus assembly pilin Flp
MGFIRDDSAQGLVEYALVIALIAIGVIIAMIFLRGQLQGVFSSIGTNVQNAPCQGPNQQGQCP